MNKYPLSPVYNKIAESSYALDNWTEKSMLTLRDPFWANLYQATAKPLLKLAGIFYVVSGIISKDPVSIGLGTVLYVSGEGIGRTLEFRSQCNIRRKLNERLNDLEDLMIKNEK